MVETYEDTVRQFCATMNPADRFHVCHEPLKGLKDADQKKRHQIAKPNGLWYGFGDSWMDWCLGENFSTGWTHIYKVDLGGTAVRRVTTLDEFDKFEDEYWSLGRYGNFEALLPSRGGSRYAGEINWPAVAEKYGAVEITPYLYERRLDRMWYYSWDCASGCVWNTSQVTTTLVATWEEEQFKLV